MASAHDIAALVLVRHGATSAMKLQKLVYYSQAWSLAVGGGPLFPEKIEAWAHGPVVRELFAKHRGRFVVSDWPEGREASLPQKLRSLLEAVLAHYGALSADHLSELTHEELPWREARAGLPAGARATAEITQESMRRFYAALPPPFAIPAS